MTRPSVLITGNMGYVGSVLVAHLRRAWPDARLAGYDAGFFSGSLVDAGMLPETQLDAQHFGDIRALPPDLLRGVDVVVHLAAVSNDPMGQRFAPATDAINRAATARLAIAARDAGVARMVFASSCSVYGAASSRPCREGHATRPLTDYARSKLAAEAALSGMERGAMTAVCLRFATACGASPRLRLDLALNEFVASAHATGEIRVLSDGTPWRPLIDVADMALAIEWAALATGLPSFLTVNVGAQAGNHRVAAMAAAVAAQFPDIRVSINAAAPADTRSYRVDFALFRALAPAHQPQISLDRSITNLRAALEAISTPPHRAFARLPALERLVASGRISPLLERN